MGMCHKTNRLDLVRAGNYGYLSQANVEELSFLVMSAVSSVGIDMVKAGNYGISRFGEF